MREAQLERLDAAFAEYDMAWLTRRPEGEQAQLLSVVCSAVRASSPAEHSAFLHMKGTPDSSALRDVFAIEEARVRGTR